MTAVVLVHGVCHDAVCWDLVRSGLRDKGVRSEAPDLPMTTLTEDAAELRRVLDLIDDDIVLLGHSWGGSVVTLGASGHPRVQHLVYLAALMLEAGIPVLAAPRPTTGLPVAALRNDQFVVIPENAKEIFYNDVDDDVAAASIARLRPFHRAGFDRVVTDAVPAWRTVPSTYVVCAKDNSIHPDDQREMSRNAGVVTEWPTGHSPFLSRPELVVNLLLDRVRQNRSWPGD